MYEVELLTVREVAFALDLSFEGAYELLVQAGTRFRVPRRHRLQED